jgi:tetratricopeptide (TPR) repeat protein
MTIHGLGGCGKSALAIECAYRASVKHARLVFWVPAISRESFELAYREIGDRLHIPGINDGNVDVKKLVRETLSSESSDNWLMIVDNADDHEVLLGNMDDNSKPARLHDFLPRSNRGAILFTTQSRKMAGVLSQSGILRLTDMEKVEARQLLTQLIVDQASLGDEAAVDELLHALTSLPLAIVQAAAFMNNNDVSAHDYISLFQEAEAELELFDQDFHDPNRYEELDSTVAKTWHISFDQIRKQDRLTADYLAFMACVDRVNIPQSMLPPGASPVQQMKALGTLKGYAFIAERLQITQSSNADKFFDMHRLVHMASAQWLERHNERAAWVETAVARLEELVPYGDHKNREIWTTYLSHTIHLAGTHGVVGTAASASLLDRVGRCQASLGQYSAAEITHRQVRSIRESVLGLENIDTLISMNEIGQALRSQGKYVEAEKMHRQTLALYKKVLGEEHMYTLTSMNNVAAALSYQGKYAEAVKMHHKTLALSKKVLGEGHPDTLTSMNNLAEALSEQGKHAEAEKMHCETLKLSKKVLGEEHPDTLSSMNNLASALSEQGKHAEAEKMHRETLKLSKKVLGENHPRVLIGMNNIAAALSGQEKYADAEKMHRETLKSSKKVLGEMHPDTLLSMFNLADDLAKQLRYDESRILYEEVCPAFDTVLGENHPTTRICHRLYREMLALQEQDRVSNSFKELELRAKEHTNEEQGQD